MGFKVPGGCLRLMITLAPYPLLPVPRKCWYDNRAADLTKEGMVSGRASVKATSA